MFDKSDFFEKLDEHYQKSVDAYKSEISSFRTGKASPILLENIFFDYYGSKTPISQAATITAMDARMLMVKPFDRSAMKLIEDAIRNSSLGFNPMNDGVAIKVPVPVLTEARRKEIVKQIAVLLEKYKVSLRNIRRDSIADIKNAQKDKEITEDEEKKFSDKVQTELNNYIKKLDDVYKAKEKDILEV